MSAESKPSNWSASYRLIAAEKWKAKSAAMGRGVTQALVQLANPAPGMKALDLASGTGEPAISIAKRVGDSGHVVALDLSGELLEIAKQRAEQRGLKNLSTRVADAHELPFPDSTFDLATCRFGVMFFCEVGKALKELRRVLKPGGRACFIAWGPFEQPYWASTMGIVHKHVGGPLLAPGGADMFRFSNPGSLTAALRDAGFCDIEEDTKTLPWSWPGTVEEVWEYAQCVSTPFRPMLERVPEALWPKVNEDVHAAIRPHSDGENVNFGVRVVMASGRKPS